jgi:hypothetical protein
MGRAGLLWVGEKFYPTPADFTREAMALGISKRIHAIPREFQVGTTWVLLAHPLAVRESQTDPETGKVTTIESPGIFKVWRPTKIEKLVEESKRGSEEVEQLEKRGITPVFVPDSDPDHQPTATRTKVKPLPVAGEERSNDNRETTATGSN